MEHLTYLTASSKLSRSLSSSGLKPDVYCLLAAQEPSGGSQLREPVSRAQSSVPIWPSSGSIVVESGDSRLYSFFIANYQLNK